jgi:hypothetical protein
VDSLPPENRRLDLTQFICVSAIREICLLPDLTLRRQYPGKSLNAKADEIDNIKNIGACCLQNKRCPLPHNVSLSVGDRQGLML